MFSIKLNNGKVLELAPDARISLVLSNPAFDRDRIMRTFSFPFQVPLTPRNQAALRHAERFDTSNVWEEEQAEMWVGGAMHDRGELVTTGGNGEQIEAVFRNIPVTVMETLKKIYLNEILETIAVPEVSDPTLITLSITTGEPLYTITIGGNAYPSIETGPLEIANDIVDQINADFPGMAAVSASGANIELQSDMVSAVGADWSLIAGLTFLSYVNYGEAMMENFKAYVESVVATPADTHCYPLMRWINFYDAKVTGYRDTVNPVFDGVALSNMHTDDEKAWLYTYSPAIRMPYILERIRVAAGLGFVAGWLADNADAQLMVEMSDRSNDALYHDFTQDNVYQWINGFEQSINLNNHVPKMTAFDFLKKKAEALNLLIEYRDGGLYINKALNAQVDEPVDWSEYMDPKRFDRTITKPEGVVVKYPLDQNEAWVNVDQLLPYTSGDGGNRIEMPFNVFYMGAPALPNEYGYFRCPITKRVGKSPALGQQLATLALHPMFFRGGGLVTTGEAYEYATADELATDGTTVLGGLSFELDGTYGIVAQMWGDMLLYPDKPEYTGSAILPENEVNRLRKWENTRVRFFHPNGSVRLVLRSVEVDVASRDASGWVQARVRGVMV